MDTEKLPSLNSIKKSEYQRQGQIYGKLITGEKAPTESLSLNEKTKEYLERLPLEDITRVVEFAETVTSLVPDQVFNTLGYYPTNKEGLKAMVATAYRQDEPSHKDPLRREMYIRTLSALSSDGLFFSNHYSTSTDSVVDSFFEGDFDRNNYLNFLVMLSASAMPVAESNPKSTKTNKDNFDVFYAKTKQRLSSAMDKFREHYAIQFPDKVDQIMSWGDNLVFVNTISRLKLFTNDEETNAELNYGSLSAGAVAYGVDTISELPLTVVRLPYNFDEVAKNPDLLPKDDPSYKETLTIVHENTHNANPDRDFSGDWKHLINEMLTDSTAWITTLESVNQPFFLIPDDYLANTGYFDLVLLGSNLVKNGMVTENELVSYGLNQDPDGFLALLDQRVKACEDRSKVESVVHLMMKRMLITPTKLDKLGEVVDRFQQNPSGFMNQECMKMWNLVSGSYLGTKFYMLDVFESLRQVHPEIQEKDYGAMRNPETGTLVDDAVDIFYNLTSKRQEYRSYFLPEDKMVELISNYETGIDFSTLPVPVEMKIADDDQRKMLDLLLATNAILNAGLNYKSSGWSDEQRFTTIIASAQELYVGINKILVKNWKDRGIGYSSDHVMRILTEVAPKWLTYESQMPEPQEVIERILNNIDGLTSLVVINDSEVYVPTPDSVFFWGPALTIDKDEK